MTAFFTGRRIALGVLLLLAVLTRVGYLLQIEHNVDHAYSIGQALETLTTGALPLVGQDTSLQFPNPSLLGYLYLPFLLIAQTPSIVYIPVIGLNVIAVLLTYRAGRLLFSERAGLIAGLLLAVNPWMIEYSRSTWTHGLFPFLLSLSFYLLARVWLQKSRYPARETLAALVSVTIITQVSLLGYFVLPHVGLLTLIFWKRTPKRALLVGLAVFVVLNALFAVGLVQRLDVVTNQAGDMLGAGEGAYLRLDPWQHTARLVSGAAYELNRGAFAPLDDLDRRHAISQVTSAAVTLALIGGALLALVDLRRPDRRDRSLLLLIWLGLPALAMSYNSALVHPFYLLLGLPAGFLLAGYALDRLTDTLKQPGLLLLIGFLGVHGAVMVANSARYYQETAHIPGAHGLSALPLDWGLTLGDAVRAHLPEGGVVFYPNEDWVLHSLAGRYAPVVNETRAPDVTIVPQRGGVYVAFHPAADELPEVPPFARRAEILRLPDDTAITVDQFAPNGASADAIARPLIAQGESWMTFLGYTLQRDGDSITLTTFWRVDAVGLEIAGYTFAPFVHIMRGDDLLRVVDGVGLAVSKWTAGDWHVHRQTFDLPSDDALRLRVGQYDGVRSESLIFILPDGTYTPTIPLP